MTPRTARVAIAIPLGTAATASPTQITPGGPQLPTAAAANADPMFREPCIGKDEWRTAPVRLRHMHGGFRGTDIRF